MTDIVAILLSRAEFEDNGGSCDRQLEDVGAVLREAAEEIERLRKELAAARYTYIGIDGKPVLARDLEDRAIQAEDFRTWRTMDTAPKDGKHCILAVREGAFIYSVQGACHNGKWDAVHRSNVDPLAWMPNVLLPAALSDAPKDREDVDG
jgi:hypothetical protein